MGILTDIYIASEIDAPKYGLNPSTDGRDFLDRLQVKDITPIELSELWSVLRPGESQGDLESEFEIVSAGEGGTGLIYRVPERMLNDLVLLSPGKIVQAASAWAALDEPWWAAADAQTAIESFVAIAHRALDARRGLFVWVNI